MFAQACPEADRILAALPALDQVTATSSEPPVHTKLRRYLQPAFTPRRAASLEPELRRIAHRLVDGFVDRGHGDFYQDYAYRYPLLAVCHLIGLPEEHHEQVKEWGSGLEELRYGNLSPEDQIVAAQGQQDSYEFSLDLVARRRAQPGDDLLSWIIQDSDSSDDPLTEAQLAYQIRSLLSAGHETSSHFLTMLMRRLLQDRERWAELVANPSSSAALVEECLRLDGPVQSLWRRAKADAEIGGVHIPAGAKVSVVIGSANADEEAFECARELRPGRPNAAQHLTFGRGIHTCVGAGIARLEIRISIEVLAGRLPGLRLAADDGISFKPSALQRMARRLFVEWT